MNILIVAILIFLNGFFALSEIALVSSKKSRLKRKKAEGSKGAVTALKLRENSEGFLSAIQVGITLIGIITGVYGGTRIADNVVPFFQQFELTNLYADQIAMTTTVIIITYFSIVIGELVPKTLALNNPVRIAIRVAPVIYYFSKIFYPFIKLLSGSTNFVSKLIGQSTQPEQLTEAELRQMIKVASTEGVIKKEQDIMLENVFYFGDKKAKHIMTHRTDVEWVDIDKPIKSLQKTLLNVKYSKVICGHGNLDNFMGILYLKDFFKLVLSNKSMNIQDLVIKPLIVPENMDAQKVLAHMQRKKAHICCVVSEYGGFEGLITIHDIIENIVGEVPEEDEISEPDITARDDKSIFVNGEASIETLTEIVDEFTVDFDKIDYSTVAGFAFNQLHKIPQVGDSFTYKNYSFKIVAITENKIERLLITKIER